MYRIGRGMLTSGSECTGRLRVVESVQDVLALLKTDVSDTIIFTRAASATAVTPLFARIKGIVCTSGGATSHLAIVAREFDIPCVMGLELENESALDEISIRITAEGDVFRE
jgi:phosphohistidine swiveling domain-containing protein